MVPEKVEIYRTLGESEQELAEKEITILGNAFFNIAKQILARRNIKHIYFKGIISLDYIDNKKHDIIISSKDG